MLCTPGPCSRPQDFVAMGNLHPHGPCPPCPWSTGATQLRSGPCPVGALLHVALLWPPLQPWVWPEAPHGHVCALPCTLLHARWLGFPGVPRHHTFVPVTMYLSDDQHCQGTHAGEGHCCACAGAALGCHLASPPREAPLFLIPDWAAGSKKQFQRWCFL